MVRTHLISNGAMNCFCVMSMLDDYIGQEEKYNKFNAIGEYRADLRSALRLEFSSSSALLAHSPEPEQEL